MNNPYRARPSRPRVEHKAPAALPNYGVQNQNWPNMAPGTQQPDIIYQSQEPFENQLNKKAGDPWDWGNDNVDNGNDSWNWSIDPSAEQQSQPQQQQPLGYPKYECSNLRPNQQNPVPVTYYGNLNGNNRPGPPPQHHLTGSNTPRTAPSRESVPDQPETVYPHYPNYGLNQQQIASRPGSTKSNASLTDAQNIQWQAQQQPTNHYYQPAPTGFDVNNQTTHQSMQFRMNNCSWKGVESNNPPNNWQNQLPGQENAGYWQEPKKEEPLILKEVDQWTQKPTHLHANKTIQENSAHNWQGDRPDPDQPRRPSYDAAQANQWHEEITTTVDQQKASLNSNHQTSVVNSNSQFDIPNLPQQWHQPQANQWTENNAEIVNKISEISPSNSLEENKISNQNWQHMDSAQYTSTSQSTSVSTPNSAVITPRDEKTPPQYSPMETHHPPSVAAVSDIDICPVAPQNLDNRSRSDVTVENNDYSHVKEPPEGSWSHEKDSRHTENSLSDLSASISQINLGETPQEQFEKQRAAYSMPQSINQWPQQPISAPHIAQSSLGQDHSPPAQFAVPNDPPLLRPTDLTGQGPILASQPPPHHQEHPLMLLNTSTPPVYPQEFPVAQATPKYLPNTETTVEQPPSTQEQQVSSHESNSNIHAENIAQTGYDQWYNQSARPAQANWYPGDRIPPQKLWTPPEPTMDSYEAIQPIQPPTEFINVDVTTSQERENHEIRDSASRESLPIDAKTTTPPREASIMRNNEPTILLQHQHPHVEQPPDNYEFASNDRNTFLETGELTDSHHGHESTPPSAEEENDDVPSDIPFLREVPGQSSSADPRRNDPTGQEQYVQSSPRIVDPRRNDPSGQAQMLPRTLTERTERRDMPSGQERRDVLPILSTDTLERRNDPSGRESSLPPGQSRNDPSGEETIQPQAQLIIEPNEVREVPGSGVNPAEPPAASVDSGIRQIPGGVSSDEATTILDDRNNTRVVTGSQEAPPVNIMHDSGTETRSKREEAVGASMREDQLAATGSPKRRDSYEDGDDEESGNSRDENRDRRRDGSPTDRRRFDYDRKGDRSYYERDREYDDEYYYDRRRGTDYERVYNSREALDRRETSFREGDRRLASRDDLDDRRGRLKDEDERDGRRRDDRRGLRGEDPRRRERELDPRYPRDPRERDFAERDRRREDRRRLYDDYGGRDPRREYYDDPYARSSRPSSRSSYNDRDYYMRSRDPYYGYNGGYGAGYDYGQNYNANYYAYLENLRRTNPTAYMEWYNKYYASQQQQQQQSLSRVPSYPEDRASVHSGRSSCEDR